MDDKNMGVAFTAPANVFISKHVSQQSGTPSPSASHGELPPEKM
jgi:hypothetical protein